MIHDIKKVLIMKEDIAARIQELGQEITKKYRGKELVIVGVLKGSFIFMADLVRAIEIPLQVEFVELSSYGMGTESSGTITVRKDISRDLKGEEVLIVEDIIDTGHTMAFLKEHLEQKGAASVSICAFLDKAQRREAKIKADYVGFSVPNEFIVGYGLDYGEKYRNLPYVGVLKEEIYQKGK